MPPETPQRPEIRPLSRRASRLFVIACLLIIVGTAAAATWYLSRTAIANQAQIEANTAGSDSLNAQGFGVTEY